MRYKIIIINKKKFIFSLMCLILVIFMFVNLHVVAKSSVDYQYYTVEKNDTLWSIANSVNDRNEDIRQVIFEIRKCNDLTHEECIQPGDELKIPI